jgi:hypothetical protein
MMNIKVLGSNQTLLDFSGMEIFVSYEKPVAGWIAGKGYFKTSRSWSRTTSQHIAQYLDGVDAQEVPQVFLDKLLLGVQYVPDDEEV